MQSSGTMQVIFGIGSDLRGMYAGFTAQGAVMSVLLAQKGITGIAELFEGKAGIFNVYFGGKYDREKMVDGLGKEYLGRLDVVQGVAGCRERPYIHSCHDRVNERACN